MKAIEYKDDSVIFDNDVQLFSNGDLREEAEYRYIQCHYEVWERGMWGNLKKDNLHTLKVNAATRELLLDKFKITKEDTVLEVGAYNGWGTAKLSTLAGQVIAIEGDWKNYAMLSKNIWNNDIKNVSTINSIVSDHWGSELFYEDQHPQARSIYPGSLRKVVYKVRKNVVPIDALVEHVDYIVMEINGAELDALRGAKKLLTSNKIRLTVAGWYGALGKTPICYDVKAYLESLGYTVYIGKVKRVYAYN